MPRKTRKTTSIVLDQLLYTENDTVHMCCRLYRTPKTKNRVGVTVNQHLVKPNFTRASPSYPGIPDLEECIILDASTDVLMNAIVERGSSFFFLGPRILISGVTALAYGTGTGPRVWVM